jgi:ribonuclease HIII
MPQETRVLQLTLDAAERLARGLDAESWIRRSVPHARYSYAANGLTVTYYRSGKLVVQGVDVDAFLERFLGGAPLTNAAAGALDDERIGTDEAGKGDYFGALCVAAVYVSSEDIARLRRIGVADSKQLADETATRLAAAIEASTPHAVVVLDPLDYNRRQRELGNVNKLLGELHAQAIREVSHLTPCRRVLTDQFGDVEHVRRGLGAARAAFDLEARPRAEAHVAVAAASILARAAFLASLKRLSDECGLDLPKGAGDPVDAMVKKLVSVVGRDALPRFAKVHFRTTEKVLGTLF